MLVRRSWYFKPTVDDQVLVVGRDVHQIVDMEAEGLIFGKSTSKPGCSYGDIRAEPHEPDLVVTPVHAG